MAKPKLLVASHILPWHADEHNRLNPRNGVAQSALHDKAFDLDVITIDENYRVVVSNQNSDAKDEFFTAEIASFHGKLIALPKKFYPAAQFLAFHREHIFQQA